MHRGKPPVSLLGAGGPGEPPLVIERARMLDPATGLDERADLFVLDGRIMDWGQALSGDGGPEGATRLDAKGLCLAPGWVDLWAELRDPGPAGGEETLEELLELAVCGGVAHLVVMPETVPRPDDALVIEALAGRARRLELAHFHPLGALSGGFEGRVLAEMGLLQEAGAIGFADGKRTIQNAALLRMALGYADSFDCVIYHHALDPDLAGDGVAHEGELSGRLGLKGIPREAELMIIERDLCLAALTHARLHISHVSTAPGLEAIRRGKERGLRVSCDVTPFHFTLNEMAMMGYETASRIMPPLRSEDDRAALVAGLASGVVDGIASGHAPRRWEEKACPFSSAVPGAPSVDLLLPLVLGLVHTGSLSLLSALDLVTARPARALGLGEAGRIFRKGPADLVLFDPEEPWILRASGRLVSRHQPIPFEGLPVQGRVHHMIISGRVVYSATSTIK